MVRGMLVAKESSKNSLKDQNYHAECIYTSDHNCITKINVFSI